MSSFHPYLLRYFPDVAQGRLSAHQIKALGLGMTVLFAAKSAHRHWANLSASRVVGIGSVSAQAKLMSKAGTGLIILTSALHRLALTPCLVAWLLLT